MGHHVPCLATPAVAKNKMPSNVSMICRQHAINEDKLECQNVVCINKLDRKKGYCDWGMHGCTRQEEKGALSKDGRGSKPIVEQSLEYCMCSRKAQKLSAARMDLASLVKSFSFPHKVVPADNCPFPV